MEFLVGIVVGFVIGVGFVQWWEAIRDLPNDYHRP